MRWIILLLLAFIPCFPEETGKPPCNAQNRGRIWPEGAALDRALARSAESCGQPEICTAGLWRYRWQPLTVHISQLGPKAKREAPCGEAAADAGPPSERVTRLQVDRVQR